VRSLALLLAVVACDSDPAERRAVLGPPAPLATDTDEPPSHELRVWDEAKGESRAFRERVRSAAAGRAGIVFAVTASAELVRLEGGAEHRLLDGVVGKPAPRADGSVAIARDHGELGDSDIWLVEESGAARALAPAPGADDVPIALPDSRIAFISGRSGVASIWTVDVRSGALVQITNRHLRAGQPLDGFVPPPVVVLRASSDELEYDAGGGELWRVALR
jgi:hypothetical protein